MILKINGKNFQLHKNVLRFQPGNDGFCDKIKHFHPKCVRDFLAKAQ
jgi:hypothetical protein